MPPGYSASFADTSESSTLAASRRPGPSWEQGSVDLGANLAVDASGCDLCQLRSEVALSSSPAHRARFSELRVRHALTPAGESGAQRLRRSRRREELRSSARAGSYTCSMVSAPSQRGSAVRNVRVQCASIPQVQAMSATP